MFALATSAPPSHPPTVETFVPTSRTLHLPTATQVSTGDPGLQLTLQENRRRRIGKTRQAEARICRIVNQYGVPPASARNLQMALVQGTMLYAAELTWSGQRNIEGEYQQAINRMARSTLGAFRSTPQDILAAESGLTPAKALLEYQQARFAHCLLAQLRDGGGPEEILTREGAGITTWIRAAAGTRRGETVEPQAWSAEPSRGGWPSRRGSRRWQWPEADSGITATPFGQTARDSTVEMWE